jgi:geranylgeranyl diphosphate/geranylgeranyl-bacteriochlorophyllide a reductase
MKTVAIVGGGPAGAMAAARLAPARQGLCVFVFEEKPGWEKPCGGGLPYKALRRYPFLLEAIEPHTLIHEAELVAASGDLVRFSLGQPLAIYSRAVLNELLLGRAREAGAEVIEDRVLGFESVTDGWLIQTRRGHYFADQLVLAAGARTPLRQRLAPAFSQRDFMLTFGYYAPGADSLLRVQFFEDFEGYAWAFPRPDHLSLGICGKVGETSMAGLKERLHSFMRSFGYPTDTGRSPVFSHLLPALSEESWNNLRLSGPGWALAGDAAGLVDPVTGEGIYFALRSGELLAEALLEGAPQAYTERVWRDFGRKLALGARVARFFYHETFVGGASTTRLVQLANRSPAFLNLLRDLIDGSQSYPGLGSRLYKTLARSAVGIAFRLRRDPTNHRTGFGSEVRERP